VAGNYTEIIQMGLVVFAMLAKLVIFCWLGNELKDQVIALEVTPVFTKIYI